jgi:hypothetical protein
MGGVCLGSVLGTIRKRSAALENLEDSGDINRAWGNVRGKVELSAQESLVCCESKHRKPWFDEECSKLVIEGSRLNYSGCRTQVKPMKIT